MTRPRRTSWLLVTILLQSLAPWKLAAHEHVQTPRDTGGSMPCPDETPEGDPCPEGCSCLCCPGHARVLPGVIVALPSFTQPQVVIGTPHHLYTFELVYRVYRPPRAA
jgi:hypothetical protein